MGKSTLHSRTAKPRQILSGKSGRALIASPPAVILLVSASGITSAYASPNATVDLSSGTSPPLMPSKTILARAKATNALSTADALILPLNVLDVQESTLLRQLLLTHGIQLDLGSANTIPVDQILELLKQAQIKKTVNQPVDIELPDANAQYQELVFKLDALIKGKFTDSTTQIHGISSGWGVWWIGNGKVEKTTVTQVAEDVPGSAALLSVAAPVPDTKKTELSRTETPGTTKVSTDVPAAATDVDAEKIQAIEKLLYGNSSDQQVESEVRWRILNVTTRPATAEEIERYFGSDLDSKTTPRPVSSSTTFDSKPQTLSGPGTPLPPGTVPDQANNNVTGQNKASSQTSGRFHIADAAPAGFEALNGPQNAFIDVYFRDKKVGSTAVTVTVDELIFDHPASVVDLLDGITDAPRVEALLSAPLPTNADRLCYRENDPAGCGYLDVAEVGVIYSESDLRLDLFVGRELQSLQDQGRVRYLPPPERNNTSILSVYTVASDLAAQDDAIDVSGRLLLGNGPSNLTAEADYNSRTDRQRLRELKLTHHFPDYDLVGGTYSYQPGGGLSDIALAGASFNSSFKTRVDLEHAFSSELVVFLSRRSIVQLAVNDRVYTGDSYAAGNQVLDTRALPDGTYEVEIRVIDPLSGSR
ncbi:MAG: TcfC E-set like domain-containing protein, partial [Granulosicoccus sp.]